MLQHAQRLVCSLASLIPSVYQKASLKAILSYEPSKIEATVEELKKAYQSGVERIEDALGQSVLV